MRRALLAVLFVGGLLAACAGLTEEDERLGRESQRSAWSRAWSAVFASAPAAVPQAVAGGPVGWIVGVGQVLLAGALAYAAARKPGSKQPKTGEVYGLTASSRLLTPGEMETIASVPPPPPGGAV